MLGSVLAASLHALKAVVPHEISVLQSLPFSLFFGFVV